MAQLPQYLNEQTEEAIRSRMLDRVPPDIDKSEGSFIWDSLAPAAYELYMTSVWAQEVLRRGFAGTTFGVYLDLRCAEQGVFRRPAVKATGQAKFTGTPGASVPAGLTVVTLADPANQVSSIEYVTLGEATLDGAGEALVDIEAVAAGAGGNVSASSIQLFSSPVPGVSAVDNPQPVAGGLDEEDDASLLSRYLQHVRSPSAGGNQTDYVNWALEVAGVGAAQVYPLWDGPGSVKVVIADVDRQPGGSALIEAVEDYIASKRPIGADVTITAAVGVDIDIAATVTLASGYTLQAVTDAFEAAVIAYLKAIAFTETYVAIARIGTLLLGTPGVVDYADLTVNEGTGNVALSAGEIGVLGTTELEV